MITMEDVQEDIALWFKQLREALILRNSAHQRNDDTAEVDAKINGLVKALRGADAEYLAAALLARFMPDTFV